MGDRHPKLVVIAGPNGAGKSTIAPKLLAGTLDVLEFVNADVIAQGLSAFDPKRSAIAAGRILLARLEELASARRDFAFETTLASRSFAPWIARACGDYRFHLVYVWLSSPDLACERVAGRKQRGGHGVPEKVIRRRYDRGLFNFFQLYRPLASHWRFLDNSQPAGPRLIASGRVGREDFVADAPLWEAIRTSCGGDAMVEEHAGAWGEDEAEYVRTGLEMDRVMRAAVREALLVHKKLGHSIVVERDGKIVTLTGEEIPVEDEPATEPY